MVRYKGVGLLKSFLSYESHPWGPAYFNLIFHIPRFAVGSEGWLLPVFSFLLPAPKNSEE